MDAIVPIVTALIGGLFGYLAKAREARTELRKLELEIGRLKAARDEEHFRHRQENYHLLLNAFSEWEEALRQEDPYWDHVRNLEARARELVNGLSVFAPEEVSEAAEALHGALGQLDWDGITDCREALVHAMRDDVAPDHGDSTPPR